MNIDKNLLYQLNKIKYNNMAFTCSYNIQNRDIMQHTIKL